MNLTTHLTMVRFSVGSRCLPLLILLATVLVSSARAEEPTYSLKLVTDPPEAIYETGQDARFVVTVNCGDKAVSDGEVDYVVDDFLTDGSTASDYSQGEIELDGEPAVIRASSESPTFLRCHVTYRTPNGKVLQAVAGAGFSPLEIGLSLPVPDDFDAFWDEQKKQLAAVPLEPELTPAAQSDETLDSFDVQVPCLGGAPVSGYLALPKDAEPKSLPVILWVHGAGVRSSSMSNAVKGARAGMLSMDINAHGIANGRPASYYTELSGGRLKNYRHDGRESRDTIYFRGMFLRLVRAINFLTSRPEWDGRTVAVIGHSQGGGQALAAGGLDDRVTVIASGVPAICDHSGRAAGRINGWPKLVPQNEEGRPEPAALEAARYVDAVNLASRCDAEAIMSVGFIDAVCPPSSCYAAYNQLKGPKTIINEPLMGHAAPAHIQDAFFQRILEHVEQQETEATGR